MAWWSRAGSSGISSQAPPSGETSRSTGVASGPLVELKRVSPGRAPVAAGSFAERKCVELVTQALDISPKHNTLLLCSLSLSLALFIFARVSKYMNSISFGAEEFCEWHRELRLVVPCRRVRSSSKSKA